MTLEEKKIIGAELKQKTQQLVLNDRKKLKITGVSDVESFSETLVSVSTCMGKMNIKGEGLKISKLDTDEGELIIDGKINSAEYTKKKEKTNFFESIFK